MTSNMSLASSSTVPPSLDGSRQAPCMWDATENILKASMQDKESAVLAAWARGYQLAFSCFPRLHVITKTDQFPKAKRFLSGIPNVTYRENAFTQAVEDAGSYIMIQWHLVWADNFTTAPHILFFDVDAVPILPLQCHHLFDDSERPMLYAWRYNRPTHWTQPDSAIMQAAQLRGETFPRAFTATMANLDFMTFWPIVAPRYVLPELRRLVTAASNESYFDAAWIALVHGSHSDMIGKTAMALFPDRVRVHLCPMIYNGTGTGHRPAHEVSDELSAFYGQQTSLLQFPCRDRIAPIEHVKHPLQGLHTPQHGVRFMPLFKAAEYAHALINDSIRFQHEGGALPASLFHYREFHRNPDRNQSRSQSRWSRLDAWQRDEPNRVCGVGTRPM